MLWTKFRFYAPAGHQSLLNFATRRQDVHRLMFSKCLQASWTARLRLFTSGNVCEIWTPHFKQQHLTIAILYESVFLLMLQLALILQGLKQKEKNKRELHIQPPFSLFIPGDSLGWWEQGLHNKQPHTQTHTRVSNPGNQWNGMRMFWKRRNLPRTTGGPEAVRGIFQLRASLNLTGKGDFMQTSEEIPVDATDLLLHLWLSGLGLLAVIPSELVLDQKELSFWTI